LSIFSFDPDFIDLEDNRMMELSTLENWLWKEACSIRGEVDAARYKDYILPLVFYKRLDDVYADELDRVADSLQRRLLGY
jgi:type I restriction enzyme M protein